MANVTQYEVISPQSSLVLDGKSTLHPFHAQSSALTGNVAFAWSEDGTVDTGSSNVIHLEVPVERVSSGNGLQDSQMYKLVDSKRFPRIVGDLTKLSPAEDGTYAATGEITMVGRKRTYSSQLAVLRAADDSVAISGEVTIDIRDFGLQPPTILFVKVDPFIRIRLQAVARKAA